MAEAGKQGDELAQTATAPGVPAPAGPADTLGDTLGRYKLERRLGEGGMGVVHCAFDPDLERRVALKVLRRSDGTDDARQRLLREARAMARLAHPNVVAVHEVGTAGDRDFVAMELIDGETLADWLRACKGRRRAHEITQAFIAAGRGLAAAHAAGLVHRDFKPHNVLCARDGRVVVTDFGLARGVEGAVALETTLRPDQPLTSSPSSLSGLTRTGSVLGTPAYMAPEQWDGGIVGPAADQFAFCVALWEALAGARPFHGQTLEELRANVHRGIDALEMSKVPRRLRRPLRRGLERDPAKRYPNMDALLAALSRADRSSSAFSISWRAALVLATAGFLVMHERGHAAPSCDPPAVEIGRMWSPALRAITPVALVAPFDKLAIRWGAARSVACTADLVTRPMQLHCLDGVLARFGAVRQGFSHVPAGDPENAMGELVDPAVCLTPSPPKLALADTPDSAHAFEMLATAMAADDNPDDDAPKPPVAPVQAFVDRGDVDPCARTVALRALEKTTPEFPAKRAAIADAVQTSQLCEDDRVRAETLDAQIIYEFELPVIGPRGQAAVKRAEAAVARVAQPDLTAGVEIARSLIESQQEHWHDALTHIHAAVDALESEDFHRAAVQAALEEIELHFSRSKPDDFAAARALVVRWLPVAKALHDAMLVEKLERADAYARYSGGGDLAKAHADLVRTWHQKPHVEGTKRRVEGEVVDAAGKPVAGATVATGFVLYTDAIGVVPLYRMHQPDGDLRETTTDATGHFVFDEAAVHGAIVAQLGDLRSNPQRTADKVKLVVGPTRTISGRVALGGITNSEATVVALSELGESYVVVGTVKPDATFELAGVPTTKVSLAVQNADAYQMQIQPTQIPAGTKPVTDLALQLPATGRTLDVLARSTLQIPIETAQVVVIPGRVHVSNVGELDKIISNGVDVRYARHVVGESVPRPALDQLKPGDLWARFSNVATGEVTVCSLGLVNDLADEDAVKKMFAHRDELEMSCQTVDGNAKVVVAPTVPPKRFD
ncbi:MAG TPA: protein kinase [Kofleriaceae bacterium]|jgi:predicted Ser/Thr protein kinase